MKDKVVIITGSSSGIGKALAFEMAGRGARLVLAARRISLLLEIKEQLSKYPVVCVEVDVTVESDCRKLIEIALDSYGKIDILINNAGISMRALFNDLELDLFKRVMDVNFNGTLYCTKFALPHLLETQGSVVGIISIGGHVGLPGRTAYSASKFAIRGFLDALRIENLKKNLHVLVVAPGFTASEIRKSALTANGNSQGETPRDENKMMSAEECASLITKAIIKRKRSLVLTWMEGKVTVFLNKIIPGLLDKLIFNHFAKEEKSPF